MYNKRFNYILVGLFVTAMLVAATISVVTLSGRTGPAQRYFVSLDNVADIRFGTQVRFEGFPIGQVERITPGDPVSGGRFRVEVSIAEGWQIPADSIARIGSPGFLGAKTLDITSGRATDAIAPGGEIASGAPADMFALFASTAAQIGDLNERNIKPLLETLQSLASTVDRDTPRITRQLATFTERLNQSLVPIQQILNQDNVEAIRRTLVNTEATTQTLAQASKDLTGTLKRVDNMAANLDRLVEANDSDVDQSLKNLQYTLSSVARTIDTIVYNLEGTARNMNEFSRLIRTNPGLLLDGTPREAVSPAKATQESSKR